MRNRNSCKKYYACIVNYSIYYFKFVKEKKNLIYINYENISLHQPRS
jgi:hypothetical protein